LYKDCATLRIRMLLNRARPQPLSSDRTSVLAGPPPFMMLSGIHRGSCTVSIWALYCQFQRQLHALQKRLHVSHAATDHDGPLTVLLRTNKTNSTFAGSGSGVGIDCMQWQPGMIGLRLLHGVSIEQVLARNTRESLRA
jgi:hypothetical protein